MTFTVSLSATYDQAVTVNYATANGTASAGTDYTSKSGTLTFAPGETIKATTVAVKGDKTKESNETFFVDLFDASSNSLISVARGTGKYSRGKVGPAAATRIRPEKPPLYFLGSGR
jgi:hypothetical protein